MQIVAGLVYGQRWAKTALRRLRRAAGADKTPPGRKGGLLDMARAMGIPVIVEQPQKASEPADEGTP